jgi:nucleotide-binding universal stress UspA family protein
MTYKTILVHIDDTERSKQRVEIAAQLAIRQEAHLVGVAVTGISRFIYQDGSISGIDPSLLTHLDFLRERAEHAAENFLPFAKQLGLTSYASEVTQDEIDGGIVLHARYADLIVIGQNNPSELSPSVMNDFPEYLILHSGRPVLVVPYAGDFTTFGRRPLIAWDGGHSATRAITDAIPLLKMADLVQLVIINPPDQDHGEQPGADIATYLARHGVKLEVSTHVTKVDVGNALLSISADLNSDLIIMGGYGHSRFREMIMGGATRTILESMTVPVLLSH